MEPITIPAIAPPVKLLGQPFESRGMIWELVGAWHAGDMNQYLIILNIQDLVRSRGSELGGPLKLGGLSHGMLIRN